MCSSMQWAVSISFGNIFFEGKKRISASEINVAEWGMVFCHSVSPTKWKAIWSLRCLTLHVNGVVRNFLSCYSTVAAKNKNDVWTIYFFLLWRTEFFCYIFVSFISYWLFLTSFPAKEGKTRMNLGNKTQNKGRLGAKSLLVHFRHWSKVSSV